LGISARGWREVLRRTSSRVFEQRLLGEAAAVALYALLALFPAMAALVWLCGLLADPAVAAERLRDTASGALPAGAAEVAGELLGRLAARPGGGFGPGTGAAAVGAALWGGTAAAAQLFGALNADYGERESRGLLRLYAVALLFALGAGAFLVLALGAIVVLGAQAGTGGGADTVLRLGRWPVLFAAVSVVLALTYRHGPSRGCPRWRWVSRGGAAAALAWLLGSAAFFLLRRARRRIRPHLRFARRRGRPHDMGLAVERGRAGGRGAQRGTRARSRRLTGHPERPLGSRKGRPRHARPERDQAARRPPRTTQPRRGRARERGSRHACPRHAPARGRQALLAAPSARRVGAPGSVGQRPARAGGRARRPDRQKDSSLTARQPATAFAAGR
jgi:membrane protein